MDQIYLSTLVNQIQLTLGHISNNIINWGREMGWTERDQNMRRARADGNWKRSACGMPACMLAVASFQHPR
jgi:hypothetical protein